MTALAWPNIPFDTFDGDKSVTQDRIAFLHTAHECLITQTLDSEFPETGITVGSHDGTHLLFGLVPTSPIDTGAGSVALKILLELKLQTAGSGTIGFQPYDFIASAVIGSEVTQAVTSTSYADFTISIPASSFTSKLNDSNIRISARKVSGNNLDVRCLYIATRWERAP